MQALQTHPQHAHSTHARPARSSSASASERGGKGGAGGPRPCIATAPHATPHPHPHSWSHPARNQLPQPSFQPPLAGGAHPIDPNVRSSCELYPGRILTLSVSTVWQCSCARPAHLALFYSSSRSLKSSTCMQAVPLNPLIPPNDPIPTHSCVPADSYAPQAPTATSTHNGAATTPGQLRGSPNLDPIGTAAGALFFVHSWLYVVYASTLMCRAVVQKPLAFQCGNYP